MSPALTKSRRAMRLMPFCRVIYTSSLELEFRPCQKRQPAIPVGAGLRQPPLRRFAEDSIQLLTSHLVGARRVLDADQELADEVQPGENRRRRDPAPVGWPAGHVGGAEEHFSGRL